MPSKNYPALRILLTLNKAPMSSAERVSRFEGVFPNPVLDVRYPEIDPAQLRSFARLTGMEVNDLNRMLTPHDPKKLSGRFANWAHNLLLKIAYKQAVKRGMRIE